MNGISRFVHLERIRAAAGELAFPKLLILLFVASLLIHGIVAIAFIDRPIALDDMFQYDMLARSIKDGNGYRWYARSDVEVLRPYYSQFLDLDHLVFPENGLITTFRAPGYPVFLAFFYLFVPAAARFAIARLAQAALAAALAPLAAWLGQKAGLSRKEWFLAAIGVGFYPILLFYPVGLASENLYIPLGLTSLMLVFLTSKKKSWKWTVLAGVSCGLTLLTRSIFAVFVLLAGLWMVRFNPHHKKAGGVFLLTAFGLCLPWSLRNSLIIHRPTFIETSAGYNMFIGYHPEGDGGFVSRIAILPLSIWDDGERDSICMQQALQFILQNPVEAARRDLVRLVKFMGPEDREFLYFYSNNLIGAIPRAGLILIYLLLVIPWGSALLLGVVGLWQRRGESLTLLALIYLLGYCFPHLLIMAEPRFHLAWVPVLMPYAALGLNSMCRMQKKPQWSRHTVVLSLLLAAAAVLFAAGAASSFPRLLAILGDGGNRLFFSY